MSDARDWRDRKHDSLLERIEDKIEALLHHSHDNDGMGHHQHHHHHHRHARFVKIVGTLNPGQSQALQATAYYPDPASADPANPDYLVDENATIFWQEDQAGAVVALTEGATAAGVSTGSAAYAADGTANVQAFASDPDGNTTPLSDPITIVCQQVVPTPVPVPVPVPVPPPSTDATKVVITEVGPPTP